MKPLFSTQKVKYVGADGGITDATIEQVDGTNARLRITENHVALAAFNDDRKTPNTFTWPKKPRPTSATLANRKPLHRAAHRPANQPTKVNPWRGMRPK